LFVFEMFIESNIEKGASMYFMVALMTTAEKLDNNPCLVEFH